MTDALLPPSGIEKATALLLSLGVDLSSKVLQYLGEGEIERVLLALSKGSNINSGIPAAKYCWKHTTSHNRALA